MKLNCTYCGIEINRTPSQYQRSKSGNVFCSRSCSTSWNNSFYKSWDNHPNWTDSKNNYRKKALKYYGKACTVCGYSIVEVLEVHHIDSNRENNSIENLDVLCPTHHTEYQLGIREYKHQAVA